jgi:hypothetical protein
MHKSIINNNDRLFYQEKDDLRLPSNGHWMVDLAKWPLSVGWSKPENPPTEEIENNSYRIDTESGEITQGPQLDRLWKDNENLENLTKVELTSTPKVELKIASEEKVSGFATPIVKWKEANKNYRGVTASCVTLDVADEKRVSDAKFGSDSRIGLNLEYYACLLLASEQVTLKLLVNGPLDPVRIVNNDNELLGVLMPMRI